MHEIYLHIVLLIKLQASASLLLTTLEKEKELLRIFLKVSQMENSMLRRMNLSSFLMVSIPPFSKFSHSRIKDIIESYVGILCRDLRVG